MITLGVFSNTIGGTSPEDVAARTAQAGVEAVQLRLEWPGLDLLGSTADRARVRRAYEDAGVEVAALAAYTNLMAPEAAIRTANREYCAAALRVAGELGTNLVVTETGSYDPSNSWNNHPRNRTAEAWSELVEVTGILTRVAAAAGAVLVYEPYVNTVLYSAAAARRLIEEVGSSELGFVLDPAGLVTVTTLAENRTVTAEACAALAGHIALVHGDDVRYDGETARWLPLGWGDVDATAVFAGLARAGYAGAMIVEHLPEALVPEALAFCRDGLARVIGGPVEGTPAPSAG